jgi:hypothetical protein
MKDELNGRPLPSKHGKYARPRISLVVDATILDRLGCVARAGGFDVTDVVRFCIENTLPKLEEKYRST